MAKQVCKFCKHIRKKLQIHGSAYCPVKKSAVVLDLDTCNEFKLKKYYTKKIKSCIRCGKPSRVKGDISYGLCKDCEKIRKKELEKEMIEREMILGKYHE